MELLIKIAGNEFIIPDTIVNMWIITIVLIVFAMIVNSKLKKAKSDEVPSNFLNVVEIIVEATDGLVETNMGKQNICIQPLC